MLQRLREKAQGWVAWLIIGMIVITFVLFGSNSLFQDPQHHKVIAKVNHQKIYEQELQTAYRQLLQQPGSEALSQLDQNYVKKELLQSIVEQTILLQAAEEIGMRLSPSRLNLFLHSISFLLDKQGHFSQEAYHRFLAASQHTDKSFRTLLHDSLLREQLQQGIIQTSFSLEKEVAELARLMLQKRSFRYLILQKAAYRNKISLSPTEVEKYYQQHQKQFMRPELVAVEYILLSLPELMNKQQITEGALESFYRENLSLFTQPKRVHVAHLLISLPQGAAKEEVSKASKRIQEISQQLRQGQTFAELAKKYSEDKGTSEKGGDLGWVSEGEMVPEFEKAAFALNKIGEVTKVVRSNYGLHLIKLLDKVDEKTRPLSEIKEEVASKLKQQLAEEQLTNLADQLATLAYDMPNSLQETAEKLGVPLLKTGLFDQLEGPREPVLQHPEVIAAAFGTAVKDEKNNSDLIKLDEQNYLVLRVADHQAATQKTFKEVKEEIEHSLIEQHSEKLAKEEADKIIAQSPTELDLIGWQEKNNVVRTSRELDADIVNIAFSLPPPNEGRSALKASRLTTGDYIVTQLKNIDDGDINRLSAEQRRNYQEALAKHWGELEFALYSTNLFSEAAVEIKDNF